MIYSRQHGESLNVAMSFYASFLCRNHERMKLEMRKASRCLLVLTRLSLPPTLDVLPRFKARAMSFSSDNY